MSLLEAILEDDTLATVALAYVAGHFLCQTFGFSIPFIGQI